MGRQAYLYHHIFCPLYAIAEPLAASTIDRRRTNLAEWGTSRAQTVRHREPAQLVVTAEGLPEAEAAAEIRAAAEDWLAS